jgi:protein-L-isoaspartate(D-aspartate) O-methyltransferase
MTDFARARRMMVDGQVRTNDVTDLRVIAAFSEVPRERFVPKDKLALAYADQDIPVGGAGAPARCLLKPMVLSKLIQAAEIAEGDKVLDVGCTTGYSTAILARLAGTVVALEQDSVLARTAAENLGALGSTNVRLAAGPLVQGWPAQAPYDAILLNGSAEVEPNVLLRQLKEGGRLVGVIGGSPVGRAMIYRRSGGHTSAHPDFDAVAPLLPGFAKPPQFVF